MNQPLDFEEAAPGYRFALGRRVIPPLDVAARPGFVLWVMLNPSRASLVDTDPTDTRTTDFTWRWGYGAKVIVNLFGWRATDRRDLRLTVDPVGNPRNDAAIVKYARDAAMVVCAWGNDGSYQGRDEAVARLLRRHHEHQLFALRLTKFARPEHPLYLPARLTPQPFGAGAP